MSEKLTQEKFLENVRDDGTIEGEMFETIYQPIEGIEPADGYLRVTMDIPGAFAETRIPYALLEAAGFVRAAAPAGPDQPATHEEER